MDVLPFVGDRVRIRVACFIREGIVIAAYNEGSGPHVTVELDLGEAEFAEVGERWEPLTCTYPLRQVEPASAA